MLHANCSDDRIDIEVRLGIHQKKVVPTNAKRGERERDPTSFFLFLSRAGSKWILSEEEKGEKGGKRRRQVFSPLKGHKQPVERKKVFLLPFPFLLFVPTFFFLLSPCHTFLGFPSLVLQITTREGDNERPKKKKKGGRETKVDCTMNHTYLLARTTTEREGASSQQSRPTTATPTFSPRQEGGEASAVSHQTNES